MKYNEVITLSEKKDLKRLGDAELEIMLALWDQGEPVTAGVILECIRGKRNWALSTLMVSLERLADKGFVRCDRSTRSNLYTAVVSESEYKAFESRSFLSRLHGNSVSRLMASLYSSNSLNDDDIAQLRLFLDELDRGNNNDK